MATALGDGVVRSDEGLLRAPGLRELAGRAPLRSVICRLRRVGFEIKRTAFGIVGVDYLVVEGRVLAGSLIKRCRRHFLGLSGMANWVSLGGL